MATRRERVVLELDDQFTTGMARAAAKTAALSKELDALDGSGRRSTSSLDRSTRSTDALGVSATRSGASIDRLSGRVRILADVAAVLGPALIPVGAVGIPALTGLAAQFGFATIGAGTAIVAFQGVGDALKAMNKAHLEPTAENLQAAQAAMEEISPAAQGFVLQLREMAPAMKELRDTAATGMFPGLTEGLESMESLLPKVQRILGAVSGELGSIAAESGESLASDRWADFFDFLATDAPSALRDMASAAGNTAHAMAEMWMAFDPLNDDFSAWLVKATDDLDAWATGLSKTQGFAEFVDYIRTTGPQVADTLGAIGNALVQVVQAAAPIAGPILAGIEAFAKAIGAVADSDLGTPIFGMVAAMSALNLAMRTTSALQKTSFGGPVVAGMKTQSSALKGLRGDWAAYSAVQKTAQGRAQATATQMIASRGAAAKLGTSLKSNAATAGKAGAAVAGLTVLTTGMGDSMGITNTASLALMGSMAGPWGAALGAAAGATLDLAHANEGLRDSTTAAKAAMDTGSVDKMSAAYDDLSAKIKKTTDVSFWDPGAADAGFTKIVSQLNGTTGKAKQELADVGGALAAEGLFKIAMDTQAAAEVAAAGFEVTGAAAREAASSTKELAAALQAANGVMNAISSEDALASSLLDTRDLLKENGKVLNANGDALKSHARAGIAARAGLVGIAQAAQQAGEHMKDGFAKTKYLDDARGKFVKLATGLGMSRAAAGALADSLGLIDRIKPKPKIDLQGAKEAAREVAGLDSQIKGLKGKIVEAKAKGATESSAQVKGLRAQIALLKAKKVAAQADVKGKAEVAALKAEIARLTNKSITISTTFVTQRINKGYAGNSATGAQAYGGIHMGNAQVFARGGFGDIANRHQAELAGPGPTRMWREPETMGEAYIPLADDDRRPRARAVAEEAVGLLGGDVEWFARGGRRGGGKGPSPEMKRLTKALEALKGSVDKQTAARDAIAAKRSELTTTVTDKFKTDIFGESNVWAAGGGNPMGILKADIAKANTFRSLLAGLGKKGLDGDALAELAATGDIGKAQAFASMSKAQLGTYESLHNQRAKAAGSVGAYAGMAAYSAQQATANAQLVALNWKVTQMTAEIRGMRGEGKRQGREFGRELNNRSGAAARRRGKG